MKIIFSSFLFCVSSAFSVELSGYINKTNCDQIIDKQVYTICYDYKAKGALYVAYSINGKLSASQNIKKRPGFYTEKSVPKRHRSSNRDYVGTGYDRGHLASDGTFDYDEKVLRKTYTLGNSVPMASNVNKYHWAKAEYYERLIALKLGSVNVINGVVYSDVAKRIGKNRIAVPDSFWKMIYNDEAGFKRCFLYENGLGMKASGDKLRAHEVDCGGLSGRREFR